MTYRKDSDFHHPYGHVVQLKDHPNDVKELERTIRDFGMKNRKLFVGKKKAVAWFVSNCEAMSGREVYVDELKKHIQASYSFCQTYC